MNLKLKKHYDDLRAKAVDPKKRLDCLKKIEKLAVKFGKLPVEFKHLIDFLHGN